jgi:pyruvate-formate lyase
MKIGEESICYQHHQAETILEKLLSQCDYQDRQRANKLKEAIEWIHTANASAIRMENKLKWYKEHENKS